VLDLSDILVVTLEQAVAAPYCSCRLADAGARVIKIERKEGDFARGYDSVVDGESAYFVWLNRGKESLVLNIKDNQDAALMHRMLAQADVFIQNLAPGAAERSGFGSEALRKLYPKLICCNISGYGEQGEYRDMKAYDLLVQCESGLTSITGTPDAPGRVGFSICDFTCGSQANMAKLLASEASWAAADMCLQTHGGYGFATEYDVERKFRETRLYQVAPISTNLILSNIATHILGLPKSF
jgi:itaconate CoA-transferase